MQVSIATRHGRLSEASQAKLSAKAERLCRIFDRLTSIVLTVDLKDPQRPKVDLNVSAEHKHDFVAHDTSDNLLTSVDAVISKVEQQLRKYKEKVQQKHREADMGRVNKEAELEGSENDDELGDEIADDESGGARGVV